jgi:hypothetical protein
VVETGSHGWGSKDVIGGLKRRGWGVETHRWGSKYVAGAWMRVKMRCWGSKCVAEGSKDVAGARNAWPRVEMHCICWCSKCVTEGLIRMAEGGNAWLRASGCALEGKKSVNTWNLKKKKNTPRAQTTRLASFGPVVVIDTQPTHLGGCLTTRRRSTHSLFSACKPSFMNDTLKHMSKQAALDPPPTAEGPVLNPPSAGRHV